MIMDLSSFVDKLEEREAVALTNRTLENARNLFASRFSNAVQQFERNYDKHYFNMLRREAKKISDEIKLLERQILSFCGNYRNDILINDMNAEAYEGSDDSESDEIIHRNNIYVDPDFNAAIIAASIAQAASCALDALFDGYTDYGDRISRAFSISLGKETAFAVRKARAEKADLAAEVAANAAAKASRDVSATDLSVWGETAHWCTFVAGYAAKAAFTIAQWKRTKSDQTFENLKTGVTPEIQNISLKSSEPNLITAPIDYDNFKDSWVCVRSAGESFKASPDSKTYNALRKAAVVAAKHAKLCLNCIDMICSLGSPEDPCAIDYCHAIAVGKGIHAVCEALCMGYTDYSSRLGRALRVAHGDSSASKVLEQRVSRAFEAQEIGNAMSAVVSSAASLTADSSWAGYTAYGAKVTGDNTIWL